MNTILTLNNYIAQKELDSDVANKFVLLDNFIIIFLPPNLTSRIQPADMAITSVLKIRYKVFRVNIFLDVYEDQSFTDIYLGRNKQKRFFKGLSFGGKSHSLDTAEILNDIWIRYEKHARITSLLNFWNKYGFLKDSYFNFTEPESDEDVLCDVSVE